MRKIIIAVMLTAAFSCYAIPYAFAIAPFSTAVPVVSELAPDLGEALYYARNDFSPHLTLTFSHPDYFYADSISVSIAVNDPEASIFYTLDGQTPTLLSASYDGPIFLEAGEDVYLYVLKAIAVDAAGIHSTVLTHSYFLGADVDGRFSTYVFSITSDDEGLYGYEQGILVPGKSHDDFVAANPDANVPASHMPGNYNNRGREWERPAHVEVFTPEGERVISQNTGLRVHGGNYTSAHPQKSLRLIARREYEPGVGKFPHAFFPDQIRTDIYGAPIISYDTLILRNGGNDYRGGWIRSPLSYHIARETGLAVTSPHAGAAVFLNGEYYGYADLNVRINEQFLEDLYISPERAFEIIDGGNHFVDSPIQSTYMAFQRLLADVEQGNMDVICAAFDVDDLLLNYALRVYIADWDWPHNNVRIWRYFGDRDSDNLAAELDGRFRFIFFDADTSFGLDMFSTPDIKSIHRLLNAERPEAFDDPFISYAPLFNTLLQDPAYEVQFANYLCDLAFEHASADNVERIIAYLDEVGFQELQHGLTRRGLEPDAVMESRAAVREFAERRPEYILAELRELFGYTDMYRVVSDGSAKINTLNGQEGVYFVENNVPVTPVLDKWQLFDHWLVNGAVRHGEELYVSFADADAEGVVYVQALGREELPPLIFTDSHDTDDSCGFSMQNPGSAVVGTAGLYLSDNKNELKKWAFPDSEIGPGGSWAFAGRSSTALDALLKIGLNFNPRRGEVVFLSNEAGEVLDYVVVE